MNANEMLRAIESIPAVYRELEMEFVMGKNEFTFNHLYFQVEFHKITSEKGKKKLVIFTETTAPMFAAKMPIKQLRQVDSFVNDAIYHTNELNKVG